MDSPGQGSVITGVIFARFSLQTLSAKFTKCRVIAAFALMASFAGEVLISATSGVFAHKPPIGFENAKENGTDQIVVIVVAMVVGVVSSPIWAPTFDMAVVVIIGMAIMGRTTTMVRPGERSPVPQVDPFTVGGLHLRPGEWHNQADRSRR